MSNRQTHESSTPPPSGDEPLALDAGYFAAIVASADDAIVSKDLNGIVTSWNRAAERMFGLPAAEMIGRPITRLFPPGRVAEEETILERIRGGERVEHFETERLHKDGHPIPVALSISPIRDRDGRVIGAAKIIRDIGERRRFEAALRESEERFRRIFEDSPIGMVLTGPRGRRILQANAAFCRMLDREVTEVVGQPVSIFVQADDRAALLDALNQAGRRMISMEIRYVRLGGMPAWARVSTLPLKMSGDRRGAVLSLIEDITERKRAEAALQHARKMEAIGNLTGGIAHDFNNLLGVIIGNLDLLLEREQVDATARELAGEALEAALRGADLTRDLLAFARRQPLRPQRVDVNALLAETVRLLRRTLGESIAVSFTPAADLWVAIADPGQLEAALAHLATNARDAMPGGGRVTVVTENRRLDRDYAVQYPDVAVGDYVMIAVSDTGIGMTGDVLARAFEPFFTTKERERGAGLGLSMVFGFAKQSGGHVAVYSEPGVGTCVRLFLPRGEIDPAAPALSDAVAPDTLGAGETVLAVEDNEALRRVLVRQLGELNYQVREAATAAAALEILATQPVDLLFSDIVMPGGMSGFDLARLVRDRFPSVRVVLTSGFPHPSLKEDEGLLTAVRLLAKPYRRADLAQSLRDALNGVGGS